jgi:anhydro-N-acetylmuramic acid kinase
MIKKFKCIGQMSGTSVDGVDLVCAEFWEENSKWNYEILKSDSISYSELWKNKLKNSHLISAEELYILSFKYGEYLGKLIKDFSKNIDNISLAATHGHTVFHQPEKGISVQIGNGYAIRQQIDFPLVCDFRSADVAKGGQGAPLVPIGDELLFSEFDVCVNIGGFANLSYQENNKRLAFDICPANFVLNHYANFLGKDFDDKGQIAKSGKASNELIEKLNKLNYYHQQPPKTLGREWLEKNFFGITENYSDNIPDLLSGLTEHIAIQISKSFSQNSEKILLSGGGVYNDFLIERIRFHAKSKKIIIPDDKIIDFKEALIFAFMGLLRFQNKINIYKSYSGAIENHSAGLILR